MGRGGSGGWGEEGFAHVTEEEAGGRRTTGATPALVRGTGRRSREELLWEVDDDDDFGVRCKVPVGDGANSAYAGVTVEEEA